MLTATQRSEYLKLAKTKIRSFEDGLYPDRNRFEQDVLDELTLVPEIQIAFQEVKDARKARDEAERKLRELGFEITYKDLLGPYHASQANQQFKTRMAEYDAEVSAKRLHHETALLNLVRAESLEAAEDIVRSL